MEVVNAFQSGKDVVLLSRDPEGKLRRSTARAEHVVYVEAEHLDAAMRRQISGSRFIRSIKEEGRWTRLGFVDGIVRDEMCNGKRGGIESPFAANGILTYEGDVSPTKRWVIDNKPAIQRPKRLYFDFEADSKVPFRRKEDARVFCFAATDGKNRWSFMLEEDTDAAERRLLQKFWEIAGGYDQLVAWGLDNYDKEVALARTMKRGLDVEFERWLWLDHCSVFEQMNKSASESGEEKRSMKLGDIAQATIGRGKDVTPPEVVEKFGYVPMGAITRELYDSGEWGRALLLHYCEVDADLLPAIEEETGFLSLLEALSQVCGIFPDSRALNNTAQVDGFMLRLGLEKGIHFPTRRYREMGEKYKGSTNMEPQRKGILHDVHVCDFSSMYPSIIRSLNISPDTKRAGPVNGPIPEGMSRAPRTGQCFSVEEEGILPFAIRTVQELRKVWSDKRDGLPPNTPEWQHADRMSMAYKNFVNAFYGVMGTIYSRFYDVAIAKSITTTGGYLIERTCAEARLRGMFVQYIDTDSLFVLGATRTDFEEFVRWCNDELYPHMIRGLGCKLNLVKLGYEKEYASIVFVSAKRYAGKWKHYKGKTGVAKPDIKGLEYKRGDAALLACRYQEEVIKRLVIGGDEAPGAYRDFVLQCRQHVLEDTLPVEEVAIVKGITKDLKEYKPKKKKDGTDGELPVHVRVAKMIEADGGDVNEGTRIPYVVTDGDGGIKAAIPAPSYDGECDRFYLWEKLVYPPVQRFLEAAFPEEDWTTGIEKARPPKPRKRKGIVEGQASFAESVSQPGKQEAWILLEPGPRADHVIAGLRDVAKECPGRQRVVVQLGAAFIAVPDCNVNAGKKLDAAIERLFWEADYAAASRGA